MLQRLKALHSPAVTANCEAGISTTAGGPHWRCVTASLCCLIASSFVLFAYSALATGFAGEYKWLWLCPYCDERVSQSPPLTATPVRAADGPNSGEVAPTTPTNLSHIVFGIGASARTWDQRRGYTELWWLAGETRGHVWLDEEPLGPWPRTCPPYRVSANASRYGNRASASRMARIVAESFRAISESNLSSSQTRWFVMGDDDTVFFLENLVAVLGKYDHEEMYYIGAPSESVEQNVMHSYATAFGGGGFAISYPAAAVLARVMDGCLDRYAKLWGSDQRVQSCLSELGVPLTRETGFHQVDLRGDAYGMLAAHPVAPLVTLHHLDYLQPINPNKRTQLDAIRSLVTASRFDPARTLQQSFCYEHGSDSKWTWSVSVSWGYTVQVYPWALLPMEMEVPLQTFQTWRSWSNGPFLFNTRPFSPDDGCKRPILFFLDRIKNDTGRDGVVVGTVTEYSRYAYHVDKKCDQASFSSASRIQMVRVFAPQMDPDVWKRAPRRHCCKTQRVRRYWGMILEVRIKYCGPGEVTTPP